MPINSQTFLDLIEETLSEDDQPLGLIPRNSPVTPIAPPSRRQYRSWLGTVWDTEWRPIIGVPYLDGALTIQYAIGQLEIAPSTGIAHIQVLVVTTVAVSLAMIKELSPTAHWQGKPLSYFKDGQTYCSKEATRAPAPDFFSFEDGTPPPGQGARTDLRLVMQAVQSGSSTWELMNEHPTVMARHRNYVAEYHELWQARQLVNTPFVPKDGWQTQLYEILLGPVSRRSILWYHDTQGNIGKSYFADHFGDDKSVVVNGGTHSDIFHLLAGTLPKQVVFFDYPREKEGNFPYSVLEQLKNGRFTSGKYQSRAVRFRVPHVVVFANFTPDTSKMSADRWMIRDLDIHVIED